MKHFRLLACLAIIATFTSVFAAWELENYAGSYKDEAAMAATVVKDIEIKEALDIEITNDEMPSVTFDAGTASVSADINVKVTANIENADEKYNFYYMPFVGYKVEALDGVEVYVPGDEVPATSAMTALEVGEDGTAVISADVLEEVLAPELEVSSENLQAFKEDLDTSTSAFAAKGFVEKPIGILVYAEKAE